MAPQAKTTPSLAPDRLSVWPLDEGRYGLDASYRGSTGFERAEAQRRRLKASRLPAALRQDVGEAWTLRLGPVDQVTAWAALELFLGAPPSWISISDGSRSA